MRPLLLLLFIIRHAHVIFLVMVVMRHKSGIHKFSTLNVDCRDPKKPEVNFQLFIDEKLSWELRVLIDANMSM